MGKISDYEKKFRKKGHITIQIIGVTLDLDEIKRIGYAVDNIPNVFTAEWEEDGEWDCYSPELAEDFSDTTIYKVKVNIGKFFRMDPVVKNFKRIDIN